MQAVKASCNTVTNSIRLSLPVIFERYSSSLLQSAHHELQDHAALYRAEHLPYNQKSSSICALSSFGASPPPSKYGHPNPVKRLPGMRWIPPSYTPSVKVRRIATVVSPVFRSITRSTLISFKSPIHVLV